MLDIKKIVLIDDFLRDQTDGDADILVIFWIIKRCTQIVILMSIVMKRAPDVEIVLFSSTFMVVRSVVGALNSMSVSRRFPLDFNRVRSFYYFCWWQLTKNSHK